MFRNRRKRNQVIDEFKAANATKSTSAVQFVEDKIRFTKKFLINKDKQQKVQPK